MREAPTVAADPVPSLQAASANQALLQRLHADEETVLPELLSGTLFDSLPDEVLACPCLAACLACWLAGWPAGRLTGCLAGCLPACLPACPKGNAPRFDCTCPQGCRCCLCCFRDAHAHVLIQPPRRHRSLCSMRSWCSASWNNSRFLTC